MKTMIKLIAYGAVIAGVVAIVRAARRSEETQVLTEEDLFIDPVIITEEVIVVTEADPDEPSRFTL